MSFSILVQCSSSGRGTVVNLHNLCTYIGLQFDRLSTQFVTCFIYVNDLAYLGTNYPEKELEMKHLLVLLVICTISACGSTANKTTTQSAATNTETAAVEQNKPKKDMICRSEKALGSNMKTKVCRPKS